MRALLFRKSTLPERILQHFDRPSDCILETPCLCTCFLTNLRNDLHELVCNSPANRTVEEILMFRRKLGQSSQRFYEAVRMTRRNRKRGGRERPPEPGRRIHDDVLFGPLAVSAVRSFLCTSPPPTSDAYQGPPKQDHVWLAQAGPRFQGSA